MELLFLPRQICPGIYIHFSVNWGCDDFFFIIQLVPKVVGHWQWVLKDWWWFPQQSSKIDIWISCDSVKGQHDNIPSWERFFCFGSLVYIKMGISTGCIQSWWVLTLRFTSYFGMYLVFLIKGCFLAQTLFIYIIRIYMMFSCQLCWQPALLAIYKKEYIYIYIHIYIHLDETSLWKEGVKFLYQILCLKVFILNIFHQILGRTSMGTSSYTSPYSWYTLGSNFEFYKLIWVLQAI